MQSSPPKARLPRRDTWMLAILLAIMAVTDLAALATGFPQRARPGLLLLPGALLAMWAIFALAVPRVVRKHADTAQAGEKLAGFMGTNLTVVAVLLTVEHVVMISSIAWFGGVNQRAFSRAVTAGAGLVVIMMYNRASKALSSFPRMGVAKGGEPFSGRGVLRATSWTGVACGTAIIGLALTDLVGWPLMFWVFALMLIPRAVRECLTFANRRPS